MTNGVSFLSLLSTLEDFPLELKDVKHINPTVEEKFDNLARILFGITDYFEKTLTKGVRIDDINIMEIAYLEK